MTTSPLIVALDYDNSNSALILAKKLDPQLVRLKVGKELFVSSGPAIVESLQNLGFEIFLDLKFHDIPNTVAKACLSAADMGVWMTNIHASGGEPMMRHVMETLSKRNSRPLITAVTVLTSMDEKILKQINVNVPLNTQVQELALLAQNAGLDGVVCSALEASFIRQQLGASFTLVTPGIRLPSDANNDQHRIMTPKQAITAGSDYLVIGRPITESCNPLQTVHEIIASLS